MLEERVASDLSCIAHPVMSWLEPVPGPDGKPAYDVLIVGAGQGGLAAAFGLRRSRVDNILLVDKAPRGREGPWRSYARMATLRSPKEFHGPDLDLPSLTYRSWHEATYGAASWRELDLITTGDWASYLDWFRQVLDLPVRNGVEVTDVAPAGSLLAVTVRGQHGTEILHARKVLLATGQESLGDWWLPAPIAGLPSGRRAHCGEAIDFEALAGKRVAVIGAGASAFDSAATALEAGAAEVHLLCRRRDAQVIQPYRWLTFRGFLRHVSDLDDVWRWRFMGRIMNLREGFPQATYDRCARHDTFRLHLGAPVLDASADAGGVTMLLPSGPLAVDYVISAIGIENDFARRPELARVADNIATWGDRFVPPAGEEDSRLAGFPYLGDDFAFLERVPARTPWLRDIHLFSIGSTLSFGPSGSSINGMSTAVPKLVSGITRGLFRADVERHWASLCAYDVPQAVLR